MSDLPSLFAAPDRKAEIRRLIARLTPLAKELSERSAVIAVDDLRIVAVQRGILTGGETGRTLSFLPAVFQAAGLEPTGQYRRSSIPRSHGNLCATWRRKVAA